MRVLNILLGSLMACFDAICLMVGVAVIFGVICLWGYFVHLCIFGPKP